MPELGDVRQYVRTLPTNTLMGFGAFAALTTYWYATRPKALKPPCDLAMQSVEVEVSVPLCCHSLNFGAYSSHCLCSVSELESGEHCSEVWLGLFFWLAEFENQVEVSGH